MRVSVEYATQPAEIQSELEQKVAAARPDEVGPDGLLRIVVKGLVFIGQLFVSGRIKRFKVERCERVERVERTAPKKAAPKKAPKKAAR